jgi:LuxR family transcriptional regulator, quorum-sensing system regulator SolR
MEHYQKSDFFNIDRTVREAVTNTGLIVWPDEESELPPDEQRLWDDARDYGLAVGCAHSSWSAYGVCGLLSVSRPADLLAAAEIDLLMPQMNWLSNLTHMRMSQLLVPKLMPEAKVVLTTRDRDVLRWTSEGKTSAEIGQILHITERTVNFHVSKVLIKLNATNKMQAVVKVMAAGLID